MIVAVDDVTGQTSNYIQPNSFSIVNYVATSSTSPTSSYHTNPSQKDQGINPFIIVGSLGILALAGSGGVFFLRKRRNS